MQDNVFYARLAHSAFARLLPLVEKIGEEGLTLHETGVPWLIHYGEATRYSQLMLEQLSDFHCHIWRSRLVLMWEYLSSCRERALVHCREIAAQAQDRLQDWMLHPDHIPIEWVRRMHEQRLPIFHQQIGEASALLSKEDLSSQEFVTALTALVQAVMYLLSTGDQTPWEREIQCYEDLYQVFLIEVLELEVPEEIP